MNNRQKMYRTNAYIKKKLIEMDYKFIYLFPHLRFMKDYILDENEFDAIGWKKGDKRIHLFQFKTNKACPKKVMKKYKELSEKYYCIPCWVSYFNKDYKVKKYAGKIIMWKAI